MRNIWAILPAVVVTAQLTAAHGGTFESVGVAGFWHSPSAWTLVEGTDEESDGIPSAGDNVIVKAGHLIEMHENHTAADVTVYGGLRGSTKAAPFNLTHTLARVTLKSGGALDVADGREIESVVMNITGDLVLEAGTIVKAAAFGDSSSVTLNLGGNYSDANTAGFALYGGASTNWKLAFVGSDEATVSMTPGASRNFGNVEISGEKTLNVATTQPMHISAAQTVVVKTGGRLLLGNGAFFSGPGSFQLEAGATMGVAAAHGVLRTSLFQNSGTTDLPSNANYLFNGILGQMTGVDLPTAVNSLTIETPDWVTLSQNVNVSGDLILADGRLETNANVIFAGQNESQIVRTNGYVDGNLARTFDAAETGARLFPVGTEGDYLPVTVDITSAGTGFGFLTVSAVEGAFSPAPVDPTLPYYWNISGAAYSGFGAKLTFGYAQEGAPSTESSLRIARYTGSTFETLPGQVVDSTANLVSVPNVTGFSAWVPVVSDSNVANWTIY